MYEQLTFTQREGDTGRNEAPMTVTEYSRRVGGHLRTPDLMNCLIRGQVSGFNVASQGHWYFDLKDSVTTISCAVWRSNTARMERPKNGDEVTVRGDTNFYEPRGRLTFVVRAIEPKGQSDLYLQYLALKEKFLKEGLFAPERKRKIPKWPSKIAMVTSPTGAVFHDVCNVALQRDPGLSILLVPVAVQGPSAPAQIVRGLEVAGTWPGVEVIILGRGGGSMEDLWCFNDERVVRAIAACPIPVVTGIGHETDVTLADFAADVRASTPSHAAEIVAFQRTEASGSLQMMRTRLRLAMEKKVGEAEKRLLSAQKRLSEASPLTRLERLYARAEMLRQRLDISMESRMNQLQYRLAEDAQNLDGAQKRLIERHEKHFVRLCGLLRQVSPEKRLLVLMERASQNTQRLNASMDSLMQKAESRLQTVRSQLRALNPEGVLERGYAYVTAGQHVISSRLDAPRDMTLHFRDGTLDVRTQGEPPRGPEGGQRNGSEDV